MNKLKSLLAIILATALLLTFTACEKESTPPAATPKSKPMKLGFSMATLIEDRWIQDRDIFLAKAQQQGFDVLIQNSNLDSDLQFNQVKEMIEQDINVLVIAANDSYAEAKCVEYARSKGVPVVIYDRLIHTNSADVYISFDNIQVGTIMAEYLLSVAPKGDYILINGPPTDYNCIMINQGYMEVLQPHIDSGDINIIHEYWTPGWVREEAYESVSKALDEIENLQENYPVAIICENDSLAWGVSEALAERQLLGKVEVVGMDADLTACQRIVQGKQGLTVYKPIQNLVDKTLEVCRSLIDNQPLETTQIIDDGNFEIDFIAIPVTGVTKENMKQTIVADGFHLEGDIYQPAS